MISNRRDFSKITLRLVFKIEIYIIELKIMNFFDDLKFIKIHMRDKFLNFTYVFNTVLIFDLR